MCCCNPPCGRVRGAGRGAGGGELPGGQGGGRLPAGAGGAPLALCHHCKGKIPGKSSVWQMISDLACPVRCDSGADPTWTAGNCCPLCTRGEARARGGLWGSCPHPRPHPRTHHPRPAGPQRGPAPSVQISQVSKSDYVQYWLDVQPRARLGAGVRDRRLGWAGGVASLPPQPRPHLHRLAAQLGGGLGGQAARPAAHARSGS